MPQRKRSLAKFSAWAHSDSHLRVQTVHGGIVTLVGVTLALILFMSEVKQCMTTRRVQELGVDLSRRETLHINFDVSFLALPCEALLMDVGDAAGKFQTESAMAMAKDGEVHKYSLDAQGRRVGLAEYVPPVGEDDNPFVLHINQHDMDEMRQSLLRGEGCNLKGWVEVQRMAGNLQIAVRPEALFLSMNAQEIVDVLTNRHVSATGEPDTLHPDASKLNASHVINELRFGPRFPGQVNPLDGLSRIDRKATGIDKYFLKVVPTDYYSLWGWNVHTNQYSVTEYYQPLGNAEGMPPSVYFLFDTTPIAVELRDTRPGLLRLLVRICAVVGGAFALTGMCDRLVHRLVRLVAGASKAAL